MLFIFQITFQEVEITAEGNTLNQWRSQDFRLGGQDQKRVKLIQKKY